MCLHKLAHLHGVVDSLHLSMFSILVSIPKITHKGSPSTNKYHRSID